MNPHPLTDEFQKKLKDAVSITHPHISTDNSRTNVTLLGISGLKKVDAALAALFETGKPESLVKLISTLEDAISYIGSPEEVAKFMQDARNYEAVNMASAQKAGVVPDPVKAADLAKQRQSAIEKLRELTAFLKNNMDQFISLHGSKTNIRRMSH